jgi:hypothetical protein
MNKLEMLPRSSSRNYIEKEMGDKEVLMDVKLGPGDLLYLPGGWIHQAETVSRPSSYTSGMRSDRHSLHDDKRHAELVLDRLPRSAHAGGA